MASHMCGLLLCFVENLKVCLEVAKVARMRVQFWSHRGSLTPYCYQLRRLWISESAVLDQAMAVLLSIARSSVQQRNSN